jgi:hypothetical protein
MVFSEGVPLRSRAPLRFPALSFWLGHMPAQPTKRPSVSKRLMSVPISERMPSADTFLTPGIDAS